MMSPPNPLATMAAHMPLLPFLLFVFLAVHVPASHGDPAPLLTTYDPSMCSDSMCGSVNIRYPFYLSNTIRHTANYTPYSCGYADLEISCEDEGPRPTPFIHLGDHKYTVLNISYDNYTIILADSDVLGPLKCPAVSHGFNFDEMWLHYITSFHDYLTFYFGCYSRDPTAVPHKLYAYQIKCDEFKGPAGAADGVSFVFVPDELDESLEQDLSENCSKNFTVPVKSEALMAINQSVLASGGYGDVLKKGFELAWSATTGDQCSLCEKSGDKCAYSRNRGFLGCLCSSRTVGNPDCKNIIPASAAPASSSLLERQSPPKV